MKSQLEVGPVKNGKVSHYSIGGNTPEPQMILLHGFTCKNEVKSKRRVAACG